MTQTEYIQDILSLDDVLYTLETDSAMFPAKHYIYFQFIIYSPLKQ